jgi:hypothetical protein
MTYQVHIKTEFVELELREILQSRPGVLLGVSTDAEGTLEAIAVTTVYDLALARPFRDAAHVVEAATDPTSVVGASGKAATASLNAAGAALATMLSTVADVLAQKPADQKSMSDAGAAVNKKADEAKKDEAADATRGETSTGETSTGETSTGETSTGETSTGDTTTDDTTTDGTDGATDKPDAGQRTAVTALIHKALADQGIVTSEPSSSADGSAPA